MGLRAVLFDMDGTLVDSVPAWHMTFNQVLELQGSNPVTYELFCSDILGESTEKDIERFFPKLTPIELVGLYDVLFPKNIGSVRLFPKTLEVLDWLNARKIKVALVTNTPHNLMELTMKTVGLMGRFDCALGGDDIPKAKPWPDIVHESLRRLKVKEGEALMVGDTLADMHAGNNARVKTVGIGVNGDYTIKSIDGLIPILDEVRGG